MLSLAVKYRPRTIEEFLGLDRVKRILRAWLSNPHPTAFLFVGEPGVGKSAMAEVFFAAYKAMVQTIPVPPGRLITGYQSANLSRIPSQDCSVEKVRYLRDQLDWHRYGETPIFGKPGACEHWFLADEINAISAQAQLGFHSTLDLNVGVFIFTCNTTEGLSEPFLTRCRQLHFDPIKPEVMTPWLQGIWTQETHQTQTQPDFAAIAREFNGNVRAALLRLDEEIDLLGQIVTV